MTVSAWLNIDSYPADSARELAISIKINGTVVGALLGIYDDSGLLEVAGRSDSGDSLQSVTTPYPGQGTWHHAVGILDYANDTIHIYINGNLVKTQSVTFSYEYFNNGTPTENDYLGTYAVGSGGIDGFMDDAQIFNSALTSDQVKLLYNQGKSAVFGSTSVDSSNNPSWSSTSSYCPPGQTTACVGPVAEWKFDEKNGQYAYDTSGNNNTGTLTNGPQWTTGRIGNALEFDGVNDYVSIANNTTNQITDSYTIGAWIYLNSFPGSGNWNSFINKTNNYTFEVNDLGDLNFDFFHGSWTNHDATNVNLTLNSWNYVSGVFDNINNRVKIYANGKEVYSEEETNTPSSSSNALELGGCVITCNPDQVINGKIDQVRIYNYARTPSQVAWEYNRGASVGYWKFDECSGTVVNDWAPGAQPNSFVGNNGTINIGSGGTQDSAGTCSSGDTGDAWYNGRTGKFGSSLNFDGADDYASVADSPEISPTTHMSLSAWIKPSDVTSRAIAVKNNSYRLVTDSSGYPVCQIHSGAGWQTAATGTSALSTTSWQQVTCTYDKTNIKVYVNGVLKGQSSLTTAIADNTNAFEIARDSGSTYSSFTGQIDDVKVWNYALTPEQIKIDYNQGAVRFGP